MRVVVTGGAGYIGTELVKQLAANPGVSKIHVLDNLSRGNYNLFLDYPFSGNEKMEFNHGDILDSRSLSKMFAQADTVFHLAANVTTPFANQDSHVYEQVNHWGTSDVGYIAEKSGVKRLVYISSTSVYGATDKLVTEQTVPTPKTYYGISKLRGESHLTPLMDKMEVLIIRCGNVFGYSHSMRFDAVINRFAFEANHFNRITIQGDGKQSRAFVHIDTVSNVLSQLAFAKIESGIYNLVEDNYTVIDIVDCLKTILPALEFLFVDQHLALRTLKVETENRLNTLIQMPENKPLMDKLVQFLKHFSFRQS
jgi:UDP-glucose 4-epimerase